MRANLIAAIAAIIAVQAYYLIWETGMTIRTTRGLDNSADRGTRRLMWILMVTAFGGAWFPVVFGPGLWLNLGEWLTWVGILMMISGIIFRRYAIGVLGEFFTATVQIRKDHQIIKNGPYRFIRHPSYLGILILALGNGIALANWISFLLCLALPIAGIILRIRVEEKVLAQHFGEQYQNYKKNTWRILPYIY